MTYSPRPANLIGTPSTDCCTMPRMLASLTGTIATGAVIAGLAENRKAQTYTQIRTPIITVGSAVTGLKIGVWTSDGATLRAESAALHSTIAAGWMTSTLTASLTLAVGELVVLGVGTTFTTTSPQFRGIGPGIAAFFPQVSTDGPLYYRARAGGAWAGGSNTLPGSLATNTGSGFAPIVELLP